MTSQKIELKLLFHWLAIIADKISATMPTSFITAAGHTNIRSPVGIAKANRSTKRKGRACQWKPCSLLFIEISCGVGIKRTVTTDSTLWDTSQTVHLCEGIIQIFTMYLLNCSSFALMASIELISKNPKSTLYFTFIKENYNQPNSYTGNKFAASLIFSDNTRETT